ncbi:FAD binding domain-containing protein [Veronia pacifica]|uniref:Carbon monoxide dehydrogenase n=1 Tax=Veronia pacifica TaxID=1080227 RepID=A0A1C3EEF4_9GAMM|nr:xanthine dehydrogenase family protein subunit M [Veronia pacifica]ODA31574.1 carbon monoxide dehydrogenase [Veronia pacifica]
MIAKDFNYYSPDTVADAIALLAEFGGDAKLLAGGHSLLPMMKMRFAEPVNLIDINGLNEIKGIDIDEENIIIGAMTPENDILRDDRLETACPLLFEATKLIADPQVRNRGTIGGDIAHGDPANDQPSIMLALDATLEITGVEGPRLVAAADFFLGTYTTAIQPNELLTRIIIPRAHGSKGWGFQKLKRKTGDYATAASAVTMRMVDGKCDQVRIALTNLGPKSFRPVKAEWILEGHPPTDDRIEAAVQLAMAETDPAADQRGNEEYKTAMAGEMLRRALQQAMN